jgi:hypothetical protein
MYYRNANCAVVVYDITQTVSYSAMSTPQHTKLLTLSSTGFSGKGKGVGE